MDIYTWADEVVARNWMLPWIVIASIVIPFVIGEIILWLARRKL